MSPCTLERLYAQKEVRVNEFEIITSSAIKATDHKVPSALEASRLIDVLFKTLLGVFVLFIGERKTTLDVIQRCSTIKAFTVIPRPRLGKNTRPKNFRPGFSPNT